MIRLPLVTLLGVVSLAACADGTAAPTSAAAQRCEAEREAARAEAGFSLQAAATDYAGSDEAALEQDMEDARVANEIATAAYDRCMAGA